MIMCLSAASVQPARPAAAFFMPGSKSGMSPIAMRSMRASIIWRFGPTRTMPPCDWPHSHWSVPSEVNQAAVIARPERLDRLLADHLLPVVGLRNFAGVHVEHQCADRHDLRALDLEIDRHRLFELGVRPAAGAEAVGAADHDQPAAQLLGVAHQHLDLLVA